MDNEKLNEIAQQQLEQEQQLLQEKEQIMRQLLVVREEKVKLTLKKREDHSNKLCHECCNFILKYNRYPSITKPLYPNEKPLAIWVHGKRNAIAQIRKSLKGKTSKKKQVPLYKSDLDIAESYGLSIIFEPQHINLIMVEKADFLKLARTPNIMEKFHQLRRLAEEILSCGE